MKTFIAFTILSLFIVGAGSSAIAEPLEARPLPPGATLACQGAVDDFGDRGRAPFSISWQSFSARQDVSAISSFYEKIFGRSPQLNPHGGLTWKFAGGLIYAIYPVSAGTHWLECLDKRKDIAAVILISKGSEKAAEHTDGVGSDVQARPQQ